MPMEVILLKDIPGLGDTHQIVKVKAGYANNYLIPERFAVHADAANRKRVAEDARQMGRKAEKIKQELHALVEKIKDLELTLAVKAGDQGRIFGNVTPLQVVQMLEGHGFQLHPNQVTLQEPIKVLGQHPFTLHLHKEISVDLSLEVTAL